MAKLREPCIFCGAYPCECGTAKRVTRRPSAPVRDVNLPAHNPAPVRAVARHTFTPDQLIEIVAIQNLSELLSPISRLEQSPVLAIQLSSADKLLAWSVMQ